MSDTTTNNQETTALTTGQESTGIGALMKRAASGDLQHVVVTCDPSTAVAVSTSEVHTWTPEERKAIAVKASLKVATAIVRDRAIRAGLLPDPTKMDRAAKSAKR